jgi:hypothetical protein
MDKLKIDDNPLVDVHSDTFPILFVIVEVRCIDSLHVIIDSGY